MKHMNDGASNSLNGHVLDVYDLLSEFRYRLLKKELCSKPNSAKPVLENPKTLSRIAENH